ncbi:hypothetical protein DPMN_037123 [Dreissena polymorpha]|uniref:Uncharacterized protein n=1 Tax=Dreissena polymorpha TaxID=45954 RepID=A0A9D4RNT4_DREPO|nr:hypothetical protein DPMN_037123 [Dreissena polymorpha]
MLSPTTRATARRTARAGGHVGTTCTSSGTLLRETYPGRAWWVSQSTQYGTGVRTRNGPGSLRYMCSLGPQNSLIRPCKY